MIKGEGDKRKIIRELVTIISDRLLSMEKGSKISIHEMVEDIYVPRGYVFMHVNVHKGYVWTKDDGETYAITDWDQFEVLEKVKKKLKGKITLDFSEYENQAVGWPYNLSFTIK